MESFRLAELLEQTNATQDEIEEALAIHSQGKYEPEIVETRRPKFLLASGDTITILEGTKYQKTLEPRRVNDFDFDRLLINLPEAWKHLWGSSTPDDLKTQHPIAIANQIFNAALSNTMGGRFTLFKEVVYREVLEFYNYDEQSLEYDFWFSLPPSEKRKLFNKVIEVNQQDFLDALGLMPGAMQDWITSLIGSIMKPTRGLSSLKGIMNSDGGAETSGSETLSSQSVTAQTAP